MSTDITWGGHDWRVFEGSGALGQEWAADHVVINPATGRLRILNYGGVSGGVAMIGPGADKVYGTWTVRYRMTQGIGSKYAILLWPESGMRPEIDFAEDTKTDPTRSLVTSTLHPDMNPAHSIHHRVSGNFTVYHTLGVVWEKDLLSFTLDGKEWARITGSVVPTDPHHLAIQANQFDANAPTTLLSIDHVSVA